MVAQLSPAFSEIEREIVAHPVIIKKIILYHVALIPKAENEVIVPIVRIQLHDMPQNGF